MINKQSLAAVSIALVLSLGIVSAAYAQQQPQTNATGLQIQVVPEIQRGHNQHLTLYAVDDNGNPINNTAITTQITNARGQQVGPGIIESNTGDTLTYKVGPNTRPQNITVYSFIPGTDVDAAQNYWVFPKGQAQQPEAEPEPIPPIDNETEPGGGVIIEQPGNVTEIPVTNETTPTPTPTPPTPPAEEIPIEVNETIPIPVPPNMTTGNETEPVQLPINETETPTGENETVDIPALPVEPPQEPTGDTTENQTEQLPDEIPASNETDTVPIEIPINSTTGNETIPVPPIEVLPPSEANQTQNTTTEEPTTGGNESQTETETEPGVTPTEPPLLTNSSQAFDNVSNATALLDEQIGAATEQETTDETQRADLRAAIGETLEALGQTSSFVVNATDDQLLDIQGSTISVSEAVDVIVSSDTDNGDDDEGDQGEDEQ